VRRSGPEAGAGDTGQSTVELAMIMPVVAILLLVVLQILSVSRDAVALTTATRAAARQAMVDPAAAPVRRAAASETRLVAGRLSVTIGGDTAPGGLVTVTVRYRAPTDVSVVGRFVGDVVLTERFVAMVE
jgi:TadE-like protein